ncbi:hypothetical protein ACI7BZ_14325 [Xanthobacter sp. AM11]|uniref:hypothetical protein n=1 Tax=Xanthobacter sp. AM11 TaxID=3380643 RepID=UPI0039BEEFC8
MTAFNVETLLLLALAFLLGLGLGLLLARRPRRGAAGVVSAAQDGAGRGGESQPPAVAAAPAAPSGSAAASGEAAAVPPSAVRPCAPTEPAEPAPAPPAPPLPAAPAAEPAEPHGSPAAPPPAAVPAEPDLFSRFMGTAGTMGDAPRAGRAQPPAAPSAATQSERHPGQRPPTLAEPDGGTADDLKLLKGIGPQNERRLHALGIFHFRQIAGWTADEALWVGSYLAFPGRIEREDWIGQAKALAEGRPEQEPEGRKRR